MHVLDLVTCTAVQCISYIIQIVLNNTVGPLFNATPYQAASSLSPDDGSSIVFYHC